jgi:DNA polymerase-3 subunit alpha
MADPRFVHLRMHSEFSLSDGIIRIDDAIARAVTQDMGALALTDISNLFGMIKFYTAARAAGIKPLIGCDVWINTAQPAHAHERPLPCRLLLLVKNNAGYLRLCELLSSAYLQRKNQGRAEILRTDLEAGDNAGLIALSAFQDGDVSQALRDDRPDNAQTRARYWSALFPDSFYLEIQRTRTPTDEAYSLQEQLLASTAQLAHCSNLPLVATHPIQFLDPEDFEAHEARVCIAQGQVLDDATRPRLFSPEQYFKSPDEMVAQFNDLPGAVENTVEIARRCNITLRLGEPQLPVFPTPDGIGIDHYLSIQSHRGLESRLVALFPNVQEREQQRCAYVKRLEFEIATIQHMGFSGYFLIVADFIQWAKTHGVPVGPGRGSGAGSLVAYALSITDLDPIHYDLLFERFLNPDRVSMPDFDIDFCQEGRDRVIRYVKETYGAHAVSQIVTFGTLSAKAVIRDVGRALSMPYNEVDRFAKLIPNELDMTLDKALVQEPEIAQRLDQEREGTLPSLWSLAKRLEGLTRNVGMHAGGVLIAPGKLTNFCPLYSADDGQTIVSQYDKNDVEAAGLVKFDFLGLRTLTILDRAVALAAISDGAHVDLTRIPLDDRAVYDDIFKTGHTTAIFQFESAGMKDVLKNARPDCIEDLIALNALYRPGPMDHIPSFIRRKHKEEAVNYPHPKLEAILSKTYGIMVYQEQVMQTAQIIANYSLGGADLLRRAMGKKKPEEMSRQRSIFVDGAAQNGILEKQANAIFDTMEAFAGYGFNKSHAAAYSVVAFQTAWMKRYYPAAFMAATLSSEAANTDKVQFFIHEARRLGLTILPPDINEGQVSFHPVNAHAIRYGLEAIKNTGSAALTAIISARDTGGPFRDLFDFCLRIDKQKVNKRVIEALIRAGAFDAIDDDRHQLLSSVNMALEAAEQAERHAHQNGLFDSPGTVDSRANVLSIRHAPALRWTSQEQLQNEKIALGFYFSGHPYHAYREELSRFVKRGLDHLQPSREPQLLAGLVGAVRTQMTRRGKMAIVTLDDGRAEIEVTVFNDLFDACRDKIKPDDILVVEGRVQTDDYSTGGLRIAADQLLTLGEARAHHALALHIDITGTEEPSKTQKLQRLLAPYRACLSPTAAAGKPQPTPNGCPIRLRVSSAISTGELVLPDEWRVYIDNSLLNDLSQWLGTERVQVQYAGR